MPDPPEASPLADLELALSLSRADRAADAALRAFRAEASPVDVVRAAVRAAASRYDPAAGLAPHALAALEAAGGLADVLDARQRPLPVLQAIALAAAEKKLSVPQRPAAVVSGEVTHLGRSALLAARAGDRRELEALFLGIVDEGWERRMAGEVLFRASLEDPGEAGHKLLTSVALWRLARALGFRDARTTLRPAVQYLGAGEPVRRPHAVMMSVLGKEWVDLEILVSGGKPLDERGRGRLATSVAAPTEEACVTSILALLQEGYAVASLGEGIGIEASKRVLAGEGYHLELVHALLFARAAHFVLEFSTSSERAYALFQAALRVRSPAPHLPSVAVSEPAGEAEALRNVAEDLATRRPREAAAHVRAYLARGHAPRALAALLAYHASLDSALANQGHNLLLAEACTAEFATTHAPEFLMALAKTVAASPKDVTASKAWSAALGP
ncbi:MAG TPA: hypothetical protein VEY12_05290 [Thermoplasmata archaeon]|nr:hypothetical protein [Thermoplasmata archaeon]